MGTIKHLYVEKIVELHELGVPAADMRIEIGQLLDEYYQKRVTKSVTDTVLHQIEVEDFDEFTKIGFDE